MSDYTASASWEYTDEELQYLLSERQGHERDYKLLTATFIDISWYCDEESFQRALSDFLANLNGLEGNRNKHLLFLSVFVIQHLRNIENECNQTLVFPRGNDYWGSSRFNPHNIGRSIVQFLDVLIENGYFIEEAPGIFFEGRRFSSRITPTDAFTSFFSLYPIDTTTFKQKEDQYGGMRLRKEDGKPCHYNNNEVPDWVLASRQKLKAYNNLLQQTEIELKTEEEVRNISLGSKLVYRIFNNGDKSFKEGGRFYGAWWTNCPERIREDILINGEPCTELDYTANHIYLAYGLNDLDMPNELKEDPYNISEEYNRKLIKLCILTAINASTSLKAFRGISSTIREKLIDPNEDRVFWKEIILPLQDEQGSLRKVKYESIISSILTKHPVLEQYLHSSHGKVLQNYDSRIAEYVLSTLTEERIPTLGIHDSFIVPVGKKERLSDVMKEAYTALSIEKALPPIH